MQAALPAKAGSKPHKIKHPLGSRVPLYIMLAPFMILFFLFTILPILTSLVLSFFNYDMVSAPSFVWIENFKRMFLEDSVFLISVRNTLYISVIAGPIGFVLAFILAWIINEFNPHVRGLLAFLFYSPALAGNVYFLWSILFSGDSYGYVNSMLMSMGFISYPIQWLKEPAYAMTIVIIVQLWMGMGVSFLANIAGLQNVNTELYEAGVIDGITNRWQEMWYITLPSILPIVMVTLVLRMGDLLDVGLEKTLLLSNAMNRQVAEVFDSYVYQRGVIDGRYSFSAAVGLFKSAVGLILVLGSNYLSKKVTDETIY